MTELVSLAQAGAVISASWAVISGVGAWKREFIGKRRIELAEQVLAKYFEVQDAIAYIRSPFASAGEGGTRQRSPGESAADAELLNRGYIVIERYTKREAVFLEFNTLKYKCMASFGKEAESVFTDTNRAVNSIFSSASMLAHHYWKRQGRVHMEPDEFQRHLDEMHEHEGIFWDHMNETDVIRRQLKTTLERLEAITAPCFREPMSAYGWLTRWRGRG